MEESKNQQHLQHTNIYHVVLFPTKFFVLLTTRKLLTQLFNSVDVSTKLELTVVISEMLIEPNKL